MNRNLVFTLALALGLFAQSAFCQSPQDRKEKVEVFGRKVPSKEAQERKSRSIAQLKKEKVPTLSSLPVIVDSGKLKSRKTQEIAHRTIAITIAAIKGEGEKQALIDEMVTKYGAAKFFTPEESAFIKDLTPSESDRIKFSWRYECAWVGLWSLGYVEKLDRPEGICDVAKAVKFLRDRDTNKFIKDAKLRSTKEILDQADLIYRYNWAVTSARVKKQKAPAKLEGGVVHERHYMLNWLIRYMDQKWDDVTTDT